MRNSKLMIAAAVAALTVGSGIAMAQSPSQAQKSPGAQSSPSSGATHPPSSQQKSSDQMRSGTTGAGSATEQKGSNAREPQGEKRSTMTPGDKGPNARGEQGTKRRSESGQEHMQQKNMKKGESSQMQKGSTTGQAPSGAAPAEKGQKSDQLHKSDQLQKQQKSGSSTMERGQTSGQGSMQRGPTSGQGSMQGGSVSGGTTTSGSVNLTSEQRTRIHEVILKERNAPRVSNVDFQLSVGTVVPRNRVKLVRVPQAIIEIQPAWRGYEYFLIGDEIVIVEPSTLKIVAIIPA